MLPIMVYRTATPAETQTAMTSGTSAMVLRLVPANYKKMSRTILMFIFFILVEKIKPLSFFMVDEKYFSICKLHILLLTLKIL